MANGDINLKIKLDGETEYKRGLKECNAELKNMESALKLVDAESKGQANSFENLQKKVDALNKVYEAAKKKQDEVNNALTNARNNQKKVAEELEKAKQKYGENSKEVETLQKTYDKAKASVTNWETELNKAKTATANIDNALKDNTRYMEEARQADNNLATSIDGYGKKAQAAAQDTDQLLNVMSKTAAMEALRGLADQIGGAFTKLGDAAHDAMLEIDAGYDTIIKKTGASGETLDQFKGIADNIYGRLPVDMDAVANAVGEVNTRFGITGDALEDVSEAFVKFARVNDTDVTTAVDDVQQALSAFGMSASDAERLLDVLTTTGQNTGAKVGNLAKKLTENATAFQEMGMSVYEATDFMGKLETAGADSSSVLSGLKRALKSATEEGKPLTTALDELEDAIKNGTDSADGLTVAYDLFGKSGAGVFEAVRNGQISFKDLANETDILNESTNRLDETFEGTLSAWDQWTVAQNNLKTVGGELSAEFYEALTPAINGLTGFVQDATTAFRELPEPMQSVLGIAGGITVEAGKLAPKLFEVGTQIATLKAAKDAASSLARMSSEAAGAATSAGKLSGALSALANPVVLAGIGAVVAGIVIAKNSLEDLGTSVDDIVAEVQAGAGEAASQIDLYRASIENAGSAETKFSEAQKALASAQDTTKKATEDLNRIQDKQNTLLEDTKQEVNESTSGWVKAAKAVGSFASTNVEGAMVAGEYAESMGKLNEAQTAAQESVTAATDAEREFIGQMGEAVSAMEADNDMTRGVTNGTIELAEAYGYANGTAGEAIEALGQLSIAHQQTREQIQAEIDEINAAMESLQAEYDAAYEAAYNSLSQQMGLFDQISVNVDTNVDEMLTGLQSQVDFMSTYGENLRKAAEMGISDGLLAQLSDGTVESAAYLQAIVDDGGAKVEELNRKFEQVENGKQTMSKIMAENVTDFSNKMSALETRMDSAVSRLNKADAAYISGAQTIQGYIRGAESYRSAIIAEFTSLAQAANDAYKRTLDQHSPSRVFMQNGIDTVEGAIIGAESKRQALEDTYVSLASTAASAFAPEISNIHNYSGATRVNSQVAVYIGDKELTGYLAPAIIKNISDNSRNGYAGRR